MNENISNNELFPSNFDIFRRDRLPTTTYSLGGGVLIAVRKPLISRQVDIPNPRELEFVCIKVSTPPSNLYIFSLYTPPCSSAEIYVAMTQAVDYVIDHIQPEDDLIVLGDFNLPNVRWSKPPFDEGDFFIPQNASTAQECTIIDNLNAGSLQQVNGIKNSIGRILDLVFSSDSASTTVASCNINLVPIDPYHPPLSIHFFGHLDHDSWVNEDNFCFKFKDTDFSMLNCLLSSADFSEIMHSSSIDTAVSSFYSILFNCFLRCVPYVRQFNSASSHPWYDKDLKVLRNKRNKSWKKYSFSNATISLSPLVLEQNNFITTTC